MKYSFMLFGAGILFLLLVSSVHGASVTHVMHPDGDVSTDAWSRYPATGYYYPKVAENSSDDDSTYVYTSTNGATIQFDTGFRCPDRYNYQNDTACLLMRAKYTGGATTRTVTATFAYTEEAHELDTVTLTSSYANYFFRLDDDGSWNWDYLDDLKIGFIANVQGFNAGIRITQAVVLQNVSQLHANITLTSFTNGSARVYLHNYTEYRTPNVFLNVTIDTYNWTIAGVGGIQNITCKLDTYVIRQENGSSFTGSSSTYAFGAYRTPMMNESYHNLSITFTEGNNIVGFNKFSTYRSYMFIFLMWLDADLTPPQDPIEDPPPNSGWKLISSGRPSDVIKYQLNLTNGTHTYTWNESVALGIIDNTLFGYHKPYYTLNTTLEAYDGFWAWFYDLGYDIIDLTAGTPEEPIVITHATDCEVTNESSYSSPYWYIWVNATGDTGAGGVSGNNVISQPSEQFFLMGMTVMTPLMIIPLRRRKKDD